MLGTMLAVQDQEKKFKRGSRQFDVLRARG
jgi:hypothetical protein